MFGLTTNTFQEFKKQVLVGRSTGFWADFLYSVVGRNQDEDPFKKWTFLVEKDFNQADERAKNINELMLQKRQPPKITEQEQEAQPESKQEEKSTDNQSQ